MKLIDDKGRLFGKVHFFDALIALLVVVGILAIALRFSPKQEQDAKTFAAEYTIELQNMGDHFLTAFEVGDPIYEGEELLGTVKAVETRPATMPYVGAEGTLLEPEYHHVHHITLTVETDRMSKNGGYYIGTQEFLNGTGHNISNGFARCHGIVREINPK